MLKENKGVTLVALVITIIVLLILAGVTLSMVMGDSGIFGKANKASADTAISSAKDAVRLATLEAVTEQYNDNGAIDPSKKIDSSNVVSKVEEKLQDGYTITGGKIKQNSKEVIGKDGTNGIGISFNVGSNNSVTPVFTNAD